jgi:hypothetical protein
MKTLISLILLPLSCLIFATGKCCALQTTEIVLNSKPAIVTIVILDANRHPIRFGTGFFISPNRIVTNSHVAKGVQYAQITDLIGTEYTLDTLIADNPNIDLAVLAVKETNYHFLAVNEAMPVEGQNILVIGNPEGFVGTVSTGIVSALRPNQRFQISAPISPGSSGSPILNESGEVIGIAQSTLTEGQNLNFAICASEISVVLKNGIINAPIAVVPKEASPSIDETTKREAAVALIDRYMKATSDGKPIDLYPFVTTPTIAYWYGIDNCTPEQAMRTIVSHYKKWPQQKITYDIRQLTFQNFWGQSGCRVRLPFKWWASDGKKSIHGESELEAIIRLDGDSNQYRICNIRNNSLPKEEVSPTPHTFATPNYILVPVNK